MEIVPWVSEMRISEGFSEPAFRTVLTAGVVHTISPLAHGTKHPNLRFSTKMRYWSEMAAEVLSPSQDPQELAAFAPLQEEGMPLI